MLSYNNKNEATKTEGKKCNSQASAPQLQICERKPHQNRPLLGHLSFIPLIKTLEIGCIIAR